jgi:uncharacterized membrane protein
LYPNCLYSSISGGAIAVVIIMSVCWFAIFIGICITIVVVVKIKSNNKQRQYNDDAGRVVENHHNIGPQATERSQNNINNHPQMYNPQMYNYQPQMGKNNMQSLLH